VLKEAPSKEQALELVTKINNIFKVIVKTNNTIPNTPTLYVYYSGPVDKEGNLINIEKARSMVEERLEAIKSNSKVKNAFYDLQGNLIPSDLYWFEIALPVNTRVKIATDTVKYYQNMFSGIREVSVQFFYSVGIEKDGKIIYLNVSSLYDKAGSPIPFFDLMVNNVFLSTEDAEVYRKRIMHLSEREIIVNNAKRMYLQSLINYQSGNYLKQLKRMHQCYYSLKWSFSSPEQSYIEAQLKKWLQSDWAIVSEDIVEQGRMWLEDGRDMIDVFVKAGDLDKLTYFLKSALSLEVRHPEAKPELAQSGFDPKKVNLSPEEEGICEEVGGYEYVVIDKLDKDEKPLKTILLRSQFTGKASREYEKYYNAIVW